MTRLRATVSVGLLAFGLVFAGEAQRATTVDQVVATVDKEAILLSDIMAEIGPQLNEVRRSATSDEEFDALFTRDKPIFFAYHGYPLLIHKLTYRRTNHHNLHVHGFKEEGTTTTPFDMVVLNELDRFHLARAVIDRVPALGSGAATLEQLIESKLIDHKRHIRQHGQDMPEIRNWKWGANETNLDNSRLT